MQEIIVIVGPTGVGKTKLSIELAKRLDAEIINGDSVAIYRGLDIGSAKPTIEEREGIVHHLLDIRDVWEDYSVFDYQKDVRGLIDEINSRGKRIIIVGGTGLYIKAALYDYKFTEGTISNDYNDLSNEELMNKIVDYNISFDVHINNRQRLVRLLNKLENKEEFSQNKDEALYPIRVIGLTTDREYLYERINKRVDLMIENGLLDEVNNLKEFYKTSRILNSGIGYKEFAGYFKGDVSLDEVINLIKQDSRRFAKRQYTFFKHQFDVEWYDVNFNDFSVTINEIYNDINKKEL